MRLGHDFRRNPRSLQGTGPDRRRVAGGQGGSHRLTLAPALLAERDVAPAGEATRLRPLRGPMSYSEQSQAHDNPVILALFAGILKGAPNIGGGGVACYVEGSSAAGRCSSLSSSAAASRSTFPSRAHGRLPA